MNHRMGHWYVLSQFALFGVACGPDAELSEAQLAEQALSTQDASCQEEEGRMTGGGSIFIECEDAIRVTHGFELHCDVNDLPNRLEINIHGDIQSRFHLEELTFASCMDDPAISPRPPNAPFDTYEGEGTGRYNGVAGARAEWVFTDAGEPGVNDYIKRLIIWDADGNVVLSVTEPGEPLTFGNHQAHRNN